MTRDDYINAVYCIDHITHTGVWNLIFILNTHVSDNNNRIDTFRF